MTQQDRVLDMLRRGWTCGTEFGYDSRYSARICELRQKGYLIERRPCNSPSHCHASAEVQWRLIAEPDPYGQIAAAFDVVPA